MLYLIGVGLKPKHLTIEALEAIKNADEVFIENYTSKYGDGKIKELEELTGKKIRVFGRQKIEEGLSSVLLTAKKNNVCMLCFGNPLTATTHIQLLLDAKKNWVNVKVIEGISVTNALARTGLDEYKFGRTTTIAEPKQGFSPDSYYGFIEKNQKLGLHTLCLLDTGDGENFLNAKIGLELLEQIEKKKKKSTLKKSVLVVCCALASEKEKIVVGTLEQLKKIEFNSYPQSIIVCGKLSEKEKEVLSELHGFNG